MLCSGRASTLFALFAAVVLICAAAATAAPWSGSGVRVSKVKRNVDLRSQLAKIKDTFEFVNEGSAPVTKLYVAYCAKLAGHISHVSARMEKRGVRAAPVEGGAEAEGAEVWELRLRKPLEAGAKAEVSVEATATQTMVPFPRRITQKENQLVVFEGNHYVVSPYASARQTVRVELASASVEAHSDVEGGGGAARLDGSILNYGPFSDVAPFRESLMRVHFQSNQPFLVVTDLVRTIEVSHWGTVSVEEHVHVANRGAAIDGSFSRFEYQRDPQAGGVAAGKVFHTLLPADATGVYYRDEIGNISTSNLWARDDAVSVELRPRFPVFGGWKTYYVLGYALPSYDYLFRVGEGGQLSLRIPFVSHIFDNVVVERATVRVVLPERAVDVAVRAPFSLASERREVFEGLLDTEGRPVVVMVKENLCDEHVRDVEITYTFASSLLMLREPLMLAAAFFLVFLAVIVAVRLDFTLSKTEPAYVAEQARMRIGSHVARLQGAVAEQRGAVASFEEAVAAFKASKDKEAMASARKSADAALGRVTATVESVVGEIAGVDNKAAERARLLGANSRAVGAWVAEAAGTHSQFVVGGGDRGIYLAGLQTIAAKKAKLLAEAENLLARV